MFGFNEEITLVLQKYLFFEISVFDIEVETFQVKVNL